MTVYYRGDDREPAEVFSNGFKKLNPQQDSNYEELFVSRNAVATSIDINAAACFPVKLSPYTYIYIIRDKTNSFFPLHAASLKKCNNKSIYAGLEWVQEYVFDKIDTKQILAAVKIRKEVDPALFMYASAITLSYTMLELKVNPRFKNIDMIDNLILKKIKEQIASKIQIKTSAPMPDDLEKRKIAAFSFFSHRNDLLQEESDDSSIAMLNAAYLANPNVGKLGKSEATLETDPELYERLTI